MCNVCNLHVCVVQYLCFLLKVIRGKKMALLCSGLFPVDESVPYSGGVSLTAELSAGEHEDGLLGDRVCIPDNGKQSRRTVEDYASLRKTSAISPSPCTLTNQSTHSELVHCKSFTATEKASVETSEKYAHLLQGQCVTPNACRR